MRVIAAKILDPTHLELGQPLEASPGDVIQISLLDAYADEDAVYDEL
jgi:hypothetical protein